MTAPLTTGQAMTRAAALFSAGNLAEARRLGESILEADPRHFYALHLLAVIAARERDFESCLGYASRALEIDPNHVEALCNRGAALRRLGKVEESLADYSRALGLAPDSVDAWNNRGVALAALNRHDEALQSYARALALRPDHATSRFNRALSRLTTGDLPGGWQDHESRWAGSDTQGAARLFTQPRWTGREDLQGKTLLLHAEQGLGDAIQFSRYGALAHDRGARVVLEAHAALVSLLAAVRGIDSVVARGEALPPFDYHCPLLSLPLAFETRLDSIPADIPYVQADPRLASRWAERLSAARRPAIGLAWSGSTTLANDRNRSLAFASLAPLLDLDATLVSLQKDVRGADRETLEREPRILRVESELTDFAQTAALVSQLDLVISVDTSVAHLAGALGKPVWILLPFAADWRWLVRRVDSPWYPSATLYRQPAAGDWDSVIATVAEDARRRARDFAPGRGG